MRVSRLARLVAFCRYVEHFGPQSVANLQRAFAMARKTVDQTVLEGVSAGLLARVKRPSTRKGHPTFEYHLVSAAKLKHDISGICFGEGEAFERQLQRELTYLESFVGLPQALDNRLT